MVHQHEVSLLKMENQKHTRHIHMYFFFGCKGIHILASTKKLLGDNRRADNNVVMFTAQLLKTGEERREQIKARHPQAQGSRMEGRHGGGDGDLESITFFFTP